jgi:antitoxin VapB
VNADLTVFYTSGREITASSNDGCRTPNCVYGRCTPRLLLALSRHRMGAAAVRIPREFELPGEDAIMRKDGERLTIEPAPSQSLLAVLATLSLLEDDFPPISELMVVSTTAVLHIDAAIAEPFCPSKIPSGQSVMRWPRMRCPF